MTKTKLLACTQPFVPGVNTAEDFVAYAARVSNPGNQINNETAPRLLSYLMRNGHWSPFEMVHIVIEVETTRGIAHQIVRHRSFAFQEFSQRYAVVNELGSMFTHSEARLQDAKNRQNSIETEDDELQIWWEDVQGHIGSLVEHIYEEGLAKGIAKEVMRNVLPEGMTNTKVLMAGSLRSWIHYIKARGPGSGTQKEHMDVAAGAKRIIEELFPSITGLLENN